MNRKYSGFTLVEMLIVMGIIIILMVVGITAGRFAINRANDVAHQNAVDQLYTSLQAFYTDERQYPDESICGAGGCTIQNLVSGTTCADPLGTKTDCFLVPYIDQDAFDGGSEATYYYGIGGDSGNQAVLACVSMRGNYEGNFDTTRNDGIVYCSGNGFGIAMDFTGVGTGTGFTVATKETRDDDPAWAGFDALDDESDWDGDTWE